MHIETGKQALLRMQRKPRSGTRKPILISPCTGLVADNKTCGQRARSGQAAPIAASASAMHARPAGDCAPNVCAHSNIPFLSQLCLQINSNV